jgi:outer membrane protein assembly factor BamB
MYRAPQPAPLVFAAFCGRVFALERRTGRPVWVQRFASWTSGVTTRLCALDGRVYALGSGLACLDAASGTVLWQVDVPGALTGGTLLAEGDLIFVADQGEVACFATSGHLLWHHPFTGEGVGVVSLAVEGAAAQADRG